MSEPGFTGRRPANPAQHRLWLVDQDGPRGIEFAYPYLFTLTGPADVDRLERAWLRVVERHTPLRTTFLVEDDRLIQDVHAPATAFFELVEAAGADPAEIAEIVRDSVNTPFDISRQWPIRVRLLALGTDRYQLLVVVHHIATDGISMPLMIAEIGQAYAGRELAPLAASYLDVTSGPATPSRAGLDFWIAMLGGAQPPSLPTPARTPRARSFSGLWTDQIIEPGTVRQLTKLANDLGTTFHGALFGLLAASLGRLSGSDDIVLGMPFAGRSEAEQQLIGFFVNLLPVRHQFREYESVAALIRGAGERLAGALEHSLIPLASIVSDARVGAGRINPLLRITLTEEQTPVLELPGVQTRYEDLRIDVARYELAVDYRHLPDGAVRLELSYAKDTFGRAQVIEILADLLALVKLAVTDPAAPLLQAGPVRRNPSVISGPADVPAGPDLAARWRRCVAEHPSAAAVVDAAGPMSFAELEVWSADLSRRLVGLGVGRGDPVAVVCRRSRDFPVALLGVLRAGGYPVLLDADQPAERIRRLVHSARASAVVASPAVDELSVPAPRLAPVGEPPPAGPAGEWAIRAAGSIAYLIYTSGTTGQPKGVAVTDQNLRSLLDSLGAFALSGPGTRIGLVASFGFDASVQQWSRLFDGATLVLFDENSRLDPAAFVDLVAGQRLDEFDISPRHLDVLLDPLLERLRPLGRRVRVLVGGEAIPPALWSRLRAAQQTGLLEAWNMYGPTECTVDSTVYPLELSPAPRIGIPLPGTRAYVLDRWLRPVPRGVTGQLHIAGAGVSRGYHGQPGGTARVFLPDPLSRSGELMYATGDLVWMDEDGTLGYAGRFDDQVKINGYRVELAELEAAALEHPTVRAASAAVTGAPGPPALCLYVVAAPAVAAELPGWLAQRLPGHLRPARVHTVSHIPLSGSGKVDRDQLAQLITSATAGSSDRPDPIRPAEPAAAEPAGGTVEIIANVWRQILNKDSIGPGDDFFSLGGHSLLAIRVASRVRREMGVVLPIADVFAHPRLGELAEHVDQLRTAP